MATPGVADLVVQLEDSLDLAALDHGVKLVGKDERMAKRILDQVPWAVMKKNFSVKKWLPDLAVEEVQLELVPFWVQIRGYGEWLKAPPIRDEVFISRPSVSGVGARRIAGAVRGAAIGIDQSRGNDSRQHQQREVLSMMAGSGEAPQSQSSATRKWRRKSKTQDVSSMAFLNETDDRSSTRWNTLGRNISPQAIHDLSPHGEQESVVINAGTHQHSVSSPSSSGLLFTIAGEVQGTWLNPRSVLAEASGMKKGGGCQSWDLVQHPFKKVRGIRDPGGSSGLLGGNWQGLNVQERCLMIQRAVYTEVEPPEGSSMSTRVLAHVEAELVDEQHPSVTQEAGNVARGGGGWPSTTARLP
ncbi:hypothetical protein ACFX13_013224 [Malus domestica]